MAQRSTPLTAWSTLGERGRRFAERVGVYLFFVSLILFTQINWIMQHRQYAAWHVEERLLLGFLVGALLAAGANALARKWAVKAGKDADAQVKKLSLALFPGILFFFAAKGRVFLALGGGLCALVALYLWSRPFRNLVDSLFLNDAFANTLAIKDGVATLELSGVYDAANLEALELFYRDLVSNFAACRRLEIERVAVDFSGIAGCSEDELLPVFASIAGRFSLSLVPAAKSLQNV
jgi:hypothetical protein